METDRAGSQPLGMETDRAGSQPLGMETDRAGSQPLGMETDRAGSQPLGMETDRAGSQPLGMEAVTRLIGRRQLPEDGQLQTPFTHIREESELGPLTFIGIFQESTLVTA